MSHTTDAAIKSRRATIVIDEADRLLSNLARSVVDVVLEQRKIGSRRRDIADVVRSMLTNSVQYIASLDSISRRETMRDINRMLGRFADKRLTS